MTETKNDGDIPILVKESFHGIKIPKVRLGTEQRLDTSCDDTLKKLPTYKGML
jgi:hypothetical protein